MEKIDQETGVWLKGENEAYARVVRALGNSRFEILCSDRAKRVLYVGAVTKEYKKVPIAEGDIILVHLRDCYNKDCYKADFIFKYMYNHADFITALPETACFKNDESLYKIKYDWWR